MTTQDKLTIEPNPVPMVEQQFIAPNVSATDNESYDSAADTNPVYTAPYGQFYGNFNYALTQSELQSLRSMLKVDLHHLNDNIAELSALQRFFYQRADIVQKEKVDVAKAFECLNFVREVMRQSKRELKKLEGIQRKLRLAITAG